MFSALCAATAAAPVILNSSGGGESISNIAITSEMLSPLVDGISANIGVILPIGIAIFAIVLGIAFIPKILKKFGIGGGS